MTKNELSMTPSAIYARERRKKPEIRAREIALRGARLTPDVLEKRREHQRSAEYRYKKNLYLKAHTKERRSVDPQFRLAAIARVYINRCISPNCKKRADNTYQYVGCDKLELLAYIEKQWLPDMSWENYGKWEIDHIIPIDRFDLTIPGNMEKANHWSNLQPLWKVDNISKSNRGLCA